MKPLPSQTKLFPLKVAGAPSEMIKANPRMT